MSTLDLRWRWAFIWLLTIMSYLSITCLVVEAQDLTPCNNVLSKPLRFVGVVLFDEQDDSLSTASKNALSAIASWVSSGVAGSSKTLYVIGFADQRGHDKSNFILSEKRANAAREFLKAKIPTPIKIEAIYCGESHPLIQTKDRPEPQNRRVEIRLD
jgi:outer membrane protein OmpA-like peptidoglycan-associated protein